MTMHRAILRCILIAALTNFVFATDSDSDDSAGDVQEIDEANAQNHDQLVVMKSTPPAPTTASVEVPEDTTAEPLDLSSTPPPTEQPIPVQAARTEDKILHIRALDKITARVQTLKVPLGEMAAFGRLRIVPMFCKKSKPEDPPETVAFIKIFELLPNKDMKLLFSGWMFASHPTVAALSHPIYDIWVKSCTSPKQKDQEPVKATPAPAEPVTLHTGAKSVEE